MLRAVFFDVGNTLLYAHPSVPEVVRQVLAEEGHIRDLSVIDEYMPMLDEYYEDRYREDDTFWRSDDETLGVWVGMYSLLCRQLGIDADAEHIARRVYDEFGCRRPLACIRRRPPGAPAPWRQGHPAGADIELGRAAGGPDGRSGPE